MTLLGRKCPRGSEVIIIIPKAQEMKSERPNLKSDGRTDQFGQINTSFDCKTCVFKGHLKSTYLLSDLLTKFYGTQTLLCSSKIYLFYLI